MCMYMCMYEYIYIYVYIHTVTYTYKRLRIHVAEILCANTHTHTPPWWLNTRICGHKILELKPKLATVCLADLISKVVGKKHHLTQNQGLRSLPTHCSHIGNDCGQRQRRAEVG